MTRLSVGKNTRIKPSQRYRPILDAPSKFKPILDIKGIVLDPQSYKQRCLDRHHVKQSQHPLKISWLSVERKNLRLGMADIQAKIKALESALQPGGSQFQTEGPDRELILADARLLKEDLRGKGGRERAIDREMEQLVAQLPNRTSAFTPIGTEPRLMGYINEHLVPASAASRDRAPPGARSPEEEEEEAASIDHPIVAARPAAGRKARFPLAHDEIGRRLDVLNFDASAQSSGWGFYYLQRGAALLEQALVQYALHLCTRPPHAFIPVTPPSIVYSEVAGAAGYMPRDAHDERQTYTLRQSRSDIDGGKPEHTLAGTAEIPFAALHANDAFSHAQVPKAVVGPSRCYRAEAGARGADTKGLYRVHEFTKVEMFGWTAPHLDASLDLFQTMLNIQLEFYTALGLRCRVLEMPSADLGASAMRKIDIEAYFPGREGHKKGPWGEVSSLSLCGDYQTRRMCTTFVDVDKGKPEERHPWTVNGTACAVPRVLAALLEVGWDGEREVVRLPEVLWGYLGGMRELAPPEREAQILGTKGGAIRVDELEEEEEEEDRAGEVEGNVAGEVKGSMAGEVVQSGTLEVEGRGADEGAEQVTDAEGRV